MASEPPPIPRMDWLDYTRLVCALWVMLEHYTVVGLDRRISHGIASFGPVTEVARLAPIGLSVFLMMSGMLITLIAQRQSASAFVAGRFARVYPLFLLCMTTTAMLSPLGPARFYDSWPQYLANLPIYAPGLGYRYVEAVYWTLVIEINFYAAVTLLIVTGAIRRVGTAVALWISLQLLCAVMRWDLPIFGPSYCFLSAGAAIALFYQGRNPRYVWPLLGVSLALCVHVSTIWARAWSYDPLIAALIMAAIFVVFLLMRGFRRTLPWAQRIGSMTYPLYLLHFSLGLTIFYHWIDEGNKWLLLAVTCALMIAICFAIDHVVEFRLRSLWRRIAVATLARPFTWWEARTRRCVAAPAIADAVTEQPPRP